MEQGVLEEGSLEQAGKEFRDSFVESFVKTCLENEITVEFLSQPAPLEMLIPSHISKQINEEAMFIAKKYVLKWGAVSLLKYPESERDKLAKRLQERVYQYHLFEKKMDYLIKFFLSYFKIGSVYFSHYRSLAISIYTSLKNKSLQEYPTIVKRKLKDFNERHKLDRKVSRVIAIAVARYCAQNFINYGKLW